MQIPKFGPVISAKIRFLRGYSSTYCNRNSTLNAFNADTISVYSFGESSSCNSPPSSFQVQILHCSFPPFSSLLSSWRHHRNQYSAPNLRHLLPSSDSPSESASRTHLVLRRRRRRPRRHRRRQWRRREGRSRGNPKQALSSLLGGA